MELRIDQYSITSDRYQYVLYEMRKPEAGEDGEQKDEYPVHLGYYTDLEHLLLKMLERGVKQASVQGVEDLMELLRAQRLYVRKASNAIIEAIHELTSRSELPRSEPKTKDLDDLLDREERKLKTQKSEQEQEEDVDENEPPEETPVGADDSRDEPPIEEDETPAPAKKKPPKETEKAEPKPKKAPSKKALSSLSSKLKKSKR